GNRFVFGGPDGERINVDGQAPGEGRDPVQNPRLVFDISNDGLHAILDFLNPANAPDRARSGAISQLMISFYRERVQRGRIFKNKAAYGSVADSTSGLLGRRIMSWSAAPAATIGYTESSCSTRKSSRTGCSVWRADSMVETTSAREVMRSPRMPKAFASETKSGATSGVATYRLS